MNKAASGVLRWHVGPSACQRRPAARFIFPGLLLLFWSTVCYSVAGVHLERRDGLPDEIVATVSGVFLGWEIFYIFFLQEGRDCGGVGGYIVRVLLLVSTHEAQHYEYVRPRQVLERASYINFGIFLDITDISRSTLTLKPAPLLNIQSLGAQRRINNSLSASPLVPSFLPPLSFPRASHPFPVSLPARLASHNQELQESSQAVWPRDSPLKMI